jgi:cytochrome c biogenesis protein CcdA
LGSGPTPSPRLQAAAVLLPCLGLFLVMPPIIGLFAVPRDVAGIPLIVVYLFGVWLWLVACAAFISRRIDKGETDRARRPELPRPDDSSLDDEVV